MTRPDFENLAHLVQDQQTQGSTVTATFRCPQTGVEATASATIRKAAGIKADASRQAKRGLWSSLRRSVTRAISETLGSGTAGRIARGVADSAMRNAQQAQNFSKAEVQAALVQAFETVQSKFRWNEQNNTWEGVTTPATAFDQRLAEAPVADAFDRGILARTLVELSAADGEIGEEERAFLGDFLDPEMGSIDELAKRGALSATELGETGETARDSIVMLAWACTMCDGEMSDSEVTRLEEIATGLGIDAAKATTLKTDAQQFLFEQTLTNVYADGKRDENAWTEAVAAAAKMGIESEQAEKFDAGYRKRCGLV